MHTMIACGILEKLGNMFSDGECDSEALVCHIINFFFFSDYHYDDSCFSFVYCYIDRCSEQCYPL